MERETIDLNHEPARLACGISLLVTVILCLSVSSAIGETTLVPPQDVRVFDTPSDGGGSLTVLWSPGPYDSAAAKYQILFSEGTTVSDPAAMKVVAEFPAITNDVRPRRY